MVKSNKVKTCALLAFGIALLLFIYFLNLSGSPGEWNEDGCGIPDTVSSISHGEKCSLTVVANSREIPDEEAFAREVIRMCMENSFRSLRFSTDLGDWPAVMEIDVYLQKKDVGRTPPVFRIRAESENGGGGHNSGNRADCYRIFIE